MTFDSFLHEWKKMCRINVSQGWAQTQDKLIEAHIQPILGDKNMAAITSGHISLTLEASKSKGHSAKTTLHLYTILYKIFDDAINFFQYPIKTPIIRRLHRPKVYKKKAAFMNPEQSLVLLEYVMGSRFELGVWIQTLTALRVGEILPLTWADVDFRNAQINVFKKFNRALGITENFTKSGNQIYVPIPPMLGKRLVKLKSDSDDFLMPNQFQEMTCYFVYRRFLRRICKTLNMPIRSSHGLRHSCTEIWYNAGASAEDIRRLLNHKSLTTTEGYIHRTDERLKKLAKKIG